MYKEFLWLCQCGMVYFDFMKCYCRTLLMSTTFGFFISMMLRNCKYSRSVAWHMEMNRKWCCVIFQDGTKLMWQGIKIMIFYTNFTTSNLTNATCYALLINIVQQCLTRCWSSLTFHQWKWHLWVWVFLWHFQDMLKVKFST